MPQWCVQGNRGAEELKQQQRLEMALDDRSDFQRRWPHLWKTDGNPTCWIDKSARPDLQRVSGQPLNIVRNIIGWVGEKKDKLGSMACEILLENEIFM